MKSILLTLGLIISSSVMGSTFDTTKVPENQYLVKAGTIGKSQITILGITYQVANHFYNKELYSEVRVFTAVSAITILVLEWKKNTYLQKAGGRLCNPNL
jgi:hypothetical protein